MPRLHTLYLPNGRRSTPFAFILDQTNPMTETAIEAWKSFAEKCGALDIMLTAETIDTDPEISDGWEPEDDEPVDYYAADQHDPNCGGQHVPLPDLLSMVQAAHAAAWVPWAPANLDPESPKVMTHREEVCPAFNDGATGCPMHDPILEGDWVTWPYFATPHGVIARICDHGVTHPTPEEYLSGFDTPHLCDGCRCAPVADFSIVVSDLANTRLPRGTLLLGVKDDPTPVTAPPATVPEWMVNPAYHSAPDDGRMPVRVPDLKPCDGKVTLDERIPSANPCALGMGHRGTHLTLSGGALVGYLFAGNPIPVPDGEGPIAFVAEDLAASWVAKQAAYVRCGARYSTGIGSLGCVLSHDHLGNHRSGGVSWLNDGPDSADRTPAEWYPTPVMPDLAAENWGTATIQPLGPDGEPVGEAKDYPLAGPVAVGNVHRVTTIPEESEPVEKWETAEIKFATLDVPLATLMEAAATPPVEVTEDPLDLPTLHIERSQPAEPTAAYVGCGAGSDRGDCTLRDGHEGLHEFGPFTRV